MTERQMKTVVAGGIPFVLHLADGRKFDVPDASRITLGPTSVIVLDAENTPHLFPLTRIANVIFDHTPRR